MKRTIMAGLLLVALASTGWGQQLPPPAPRSTSKALPLQSPLQDAERFAAIEQMPVSELQARFAKRGITLSDAGRVHVEIVGPKGAEPVAAEFVESFGGTVEGSWRHRVDCWLPVERLSAAARELPPGYFIENANSLVQVSTPGEGPPAINSADYPDGAGIAIGICDLSFGNLAAAVATGDAPAGYEAVNYTGEAFESGDIHGTGCVEAVYDHCPAATYYLYRLDSLTDLGNAVWHGLTHGVRIFSVSVNRFIDGWHDDEGDACDAANFAGENGMLFFVAAGNYARVHYQGLYTPGSGSAYWHDFGPSDETIDIIIPQGGSCTFAMQFDTDGSTDYDLFLFDANMIEIDSSENPGDYPEVIEWENEQPGPVLVQLAVYRDDGGSRGFEIFEDGDGEWQEHIVAASSVGQPNNATNANVISVGAVHWSNYGEPAGTHTINMPYSSRGPSNDGMPLPDVCGPTETYSVVYGGGMGGTSNATPNCAGAAACFWASDLLLDDAAETWLIVQQAAAYRDWGDPGHDMIYGYGGMRLVDYAPGTLWLARMLMNVADLREFPLYHVAAAQTMAPPGGRLLFIAGGNYPEPVTLNKILTVEAVGLDAIVGE